MDMTGEERIAASRAAVWAALNDPEVLRQCIPGCESLEKLSPTDMTARVKLQIGPVRATFQGKVTLSDLDPPNGYRISGEGQGGVAGYAKGGAVVRLTEDGAGTLLTYEAKADVGGKLAQLGGTADRFDRQEACRRVLSEVRRSGRRAGARGAGSACKEGKLVAQALAPAIRRQRQLIGLREPAELAAPRPFSAAPCAARRRGGCTRR